MAPLNRVEYEGAPNTKIACKSTFTSNNWAQWLLFPFDFPGHSGFVNLSPFGTLDPAYADTFAIENSQDGTESLVVFNATISPSVGASFSTAAIYLCADSDGRDARLAHLVVIRKYELPLFNYLNC